MPRYWVIAPYSSANAARFNQVWAFDLEQNTISIGWHECGDVSNMTREQLANAVAQNYPDRPPHTQSLITNMLWNFYHEISPGDVVIARRGLRQLVAIGTVSAGDRFVPGHNPDLAMAPYIHSGFLSVQWHPQQREVTFDHNVFPMHTLAERIEEQFQNLISDENEPINPAEVLAGVEDQTAFVLERYLEDFIVSNFRTIFGDQLVLFADGQGADGQQYSTDVGIIDILAYEPGANSLVVIELKKGRPSDQVVGQVLRYMGWVKDNLCASGQSVRGLIICRDQDPRMVYAVKMVPNVQVKYYNVMFNLNDTPQLLNRL